jgi:sugar phosphate permease
MSTSGRIGCFFLIVGAVIMGLFLASDAAHKPQLNFLLAGAAICLIGFALWRRGRPAPRDSGRFRILRGGYNDDEEEEDDDQE